MTELPAVPQIASPRELRLALRGTAHPRPTFGAAPGYLQCNLLILPHGLARDFSAFCAANAQACPLIYQTSPGQWDMPELGDDIDLRTDLGSYRVFRDGQAVADLLDLDGTWQGDFVTFVLGSSHGLDTTLAAAGIATPYLARGETPAHYITGVEAEASGTFRGPLGVTMRPFRAKDADRVRALCAAYPHLHGAPLPAGDAEALGIEHLRAPVADVGPPATIREGEVPLFWASALTAQLALSATRLPFCIANTPGHLLVTDIDVEALRADTDAPEEDGRPESVSAPAAQAAPIAHPLPVTAAPVAAAPAVAKDPVIEGDNGYASAIRPARSARPQQAGARDTSAAPPAEADDEALRRIDEEEAAAIAADAAGAGQDFTWDDADLRDDPDIPPFDDAPDTGAGWSVADQDDASQDPFAGFGDDDDPEGPGMPGHERMEPPDLPNPMAWRQPPLSAGKLIRQRLAAAGEQPNGRKRESIFW